MLQLGFSQAGSKVAPPTTTAGADNCLLALFSAHTGHFILLVESRGPIVGANMMRKHFGWYIKNFPGAGALRRELVTAKDKDAMDVILSTAIKNSRTILKASA